MMAKRTSRYFVITALAGSLTLLLGLRYLSSEEIWHHRHRSQRTSSSGTGIGVHHTASLPRNVTPRYRFSIPVVLAKRKTPPSGKANETFGVRVSDDSTRNRPIQPNVTFNVTNVISSSKRKSREIRQGQIARANDRSDDEGLNDRGFSRSATFISDANFTALPVRYQGEKPRPSIGKWLLDVPRCDLQVRVNHFKAACKQFPLLPTKHAKYLQERPRFAVDSIHKAIWLVVPETNIEDLMNAHELEAANSEKEVAMAELIFTVKRAPVRRINEEFSRNFTKIIVARHPLQRFVSGYYDLIVNGNQYANLCVTLRQKIGMPSPAEACQRNSTLTFPEFARLVQLKFFTPYNRWRPLTEQLQACLVDLDFIFKLETLSGDMHQLSQKTKQNVNRFHANENLRIANSSYHVTRHDKVLASLQRTHPRIFGWLLKKYRFDMTAFGYTWDTKTKKSGCTDQDQLSC